MRAIDKYKKIQELYQVKVPFNVWRLFECDQSYLSRNGIEILGSQISLGGDWMELDEAKEVFEWLTEQFGGVILWDVE